MITVDWQQELTSALISSAAMNNAVYDQRLVQLQKVHAGDPVSCLRLASGLIVSKARMIDHTLVILKRHAHDVLRIASRLSNRVEPVTYTELLGIEGQMAAEYFSQWHDLKLDWKSDATHPIPDDWHFVGVRKSQIMRGKHTSNRWATKPVQAMLNYGYAVLAGRVKFSIVCAGMDPAIGFFHAKHHRKQAPRDPLVLDLMEPSRPIVDRAIIEFAMSQKLDPSDFIIVRKSPVYPSGNVRLSHDLARTVAVLADDAIKVNPLKFLLDPFYRLLFGENRPYYLS